MLSRFVPQSCHLTGQANALYRWRPVHFGMRMTNIIDKGFCMVNTAQQVSELVLLGCVVKSVFVYCCLCLESGYLCSFPYFCYLVGAHAASITYCLNPLPSSLLVLAFDVVTCTTSTLLKLVDAV